MLPIDATRLIADRQVSRRKATRRQSPHVWTLRETTASAALSSVTDTTTPELASLLDRFVAGEDVSLAAANRLEVLLSDGFPDDELVQDRVGDLAQYRPGGGDFLFDEKEMRGRLSGLRDYLTMPR